jgi:hypothetical protein
MPLSMAATRTAHTTMARNPNPELPKVTPTTISTQNWIRSRIFFNSNAGCQVLRCPLHVWILARCRHRSISDGHSSASPTITSSEFWAKTVARGLSGFMGSCILPSSSTTRMK